MKSEDKINKALNVLDDMCSREKSLVNKFIVSDMSKSLRISFQDIQRTLDSQDNHVDEKNEDIKTAKTLLKDIFKDITKDNRLSPDTFDRLVEVLK